MYIEVYTNRNITGHPLRPAMTALPPLLFGIGILLLIFMAVAYHYLGKAGLVAASKTNPLLMNDPQPYWVQILVLIALAGLGFYLIAMGISRYQNAQTGRNHLRFNEPLAKVEGFPTFISDTDTGRGPNQLLVGGKTFDLIDCSRSGGLNLDDYQWGESTLIRGFVRAWFIPSTVQLVRAEWRPFSSDEIIKQVDEFLNKSRSWDPDISKWVPAAQSDPRVYEDCRKLVAAFKKLIAEDCQRLEGLKPSLFPGVSMRKRRKAENEYDLLINRIRFNRGTLIKGLKSLKTKLRKQK